MRESDIMKHCSSKEDISKVKMALFKIERSMKRAEGMGGQLSANGYGVWFYYPSVYQQPRYRFDKGDDKRVSPLDAVLLGREDYKFTGDHVTDTSYILGIWREWVDGFKEGFVGNRLEVLKIEQKPNDGRCFIN